MVRGFLQQEWGHPVQTECTWALESHRSESRLHLSLPVQLLKSYSSPSFFLWEMEMMHTPWNSCNNRKNIYKSLNIVPYTESILLLLLSPECPFLCSGNNTYALFHGSKREEGGKSRAWDLGEDEWLLALDVHWGEVDFAFLPLQEAWRCP